MLISKEFSSLLNFWIFYLEIRYLVRKKWEWYGCRKNGENLFEEFQRLCNAYAMLCTDPSFATINFIVILASQSIVS